MQPWLKFYEAITKPLPVASSLFLLVATSFCLLANERILAKLGLSHAVAEYRFIVGLGFIIAASWIAVTVLIWIFKRLHEARKQHKRLHSLTADERRILAGYVTGEVRTVIFHAAPDLGTAQGLADDGILYKPDVLQDEQVATAYNIRESALAYLSKNRELVAAVVSAKTRWGWFRPNSSTDWFARIPAWLAIVLTAIGLYFTYRSYNTTMKSADAAKQSADAAVATLRPWIKINTIELRDSIGPAKTLMFHWPTTGAGIPPTLQVRVTFVNVGRSVAQDAEVFPELFFGQFVSDKWFDTVSREQERFCRSIADRKPAGAVGVVFPSDSSEQNIGVSGILHDAYMMSTKGSSVAASLITCVNYRGTSTTHYQTQALSGLYENNSVLIKLGVDADASHLKLIREGNGDHAN